MPEFFQCERSAGLQPGCPLADFPVWEVLCPQVPLSDGLIAIKTVRRAPPSALPRVGPIEFDSYNCKGMQPGRVTAGHRLLRTPLLTPANYFWLSGLIASRALAMMAAISSSFCSTRFL